VKPNDPARFARELQGDFSEVDAYFAAERIKIILAFGFLALWFLLVYWLA
jgi:hypothetical protein